MCDVSVRQASIDDLLAIHSLIRESFAAMSDYSTIDSLPMLEKAATDLINLELLPDKFREVYLQTNDADFWVAASLERGVVGCVGIKRVNGEEAELVRMSVGKGYRSSGIGGKLVEELFNYCLDHRILRVRLTTGNPLSSKFYQKHGFITVHESSFSPHPGVSVTVFEMCKYLGEVIVRHVTVVGGTHGNERLGVELVNQWRANPELIKRATFDSVAICGNPRAVAVNRRYVDEDLNRLFTGDAISTAEHSEGARARELNRMLGPKVRYYAEHTGSDFIVDLHSSNSNVGLMAMISAADEDVTALRLAHYLQSKFPSLRITTSPGGKHNSYSVDSITPSGIAFEVGPLVHGTLSSELLERTRELVQHTLYYLDKRNIDLIAEGVHSARRLKASDKFVDNYGSGEFDSLTSTVVSHALAPITLVPTSFPQVELYMYCGCIKYPSADNTTGGDSFAVSYSSSFPGQYIVHPTFENSDWKPLQTGAPLFISTDGTSHTILYDRTKHAQLLPITNEQQGWDQQSELELYPVFINEAAYQDRGIACALYRKEFATVI